MSEIAKIAKLLDRLAELDQESWKTIVRITTDASKMDENIEDMIIQDTILRAIVARGWGYDIEYSPLYDGGKYGVTIYHMDVGTTYADPFLEALLVEYVAALEYVAMLEAMKK